MAYDKQTWQTGDIVTSAKLNHMEDGIAAGGGGGVMFVHETDDDTQALDKTWQEIYDAFDGGYLVALVCISGDVGYLTSVPVQSFIDNKYHINFFGPDWVNKYVASSASDYPVYSNS